MYQKRVEGARPITWKKGRIGRGKRAQWWTEKCTIGKCELRKKLIGMKDLREKKCRQEYLRERSKYKKTCEESRKR